MDNIIKAEQRLWLDGMNAYRELCAPEIVMVFPGKAGILRGLDLIIAATQDAPQWGEVKMNNIDVRHANDTAVMTYHAVATRADGHVYEASCSSIWMKFVQGWRLVCHTQSSPKAV